MIQNELFANVLSNPVRELVGRVELYIYQDSTLVRVCGCNDALKSFTIERVGENKFFGYGICQKLNVKLIDVDRSINISTDNYLEAVLGVGSEYLYPFPNFFISQVRRDETTNELSVTAYDALYQAGQHTFAELGIKNGFTIKSLAEACASVLGLPLNIVSDSANFDLTYPDGANFDGTETLRQVLNYIAEVTQTIYYLDKNWELTFKQLDRDGEPVYTIDKEKYFSLDNKANKRLGKITHISGLGETITASSVSSGSSQYLRENPLLSIRNDVDDILQIGINDIGSLTISQFDCTWRGNWLLEIGDKFGLVTKDNKVVNAFLLNDVISFDGTMSQKTQWTFDDNEGETEDNPTTIGEAIKRTYAKVDKVNQEITLFISEKEGELNSKVTELDMTADAIKAYVEQSMQNIDGQIGVFEQDIDLVTKKVEATMSSSDVEILVSQTLQKGIQSVTTTTGYKFDEVGLTVSKSDSPISTTVTEDGMYVKRDNETLLSANQKGVEANNLKSNYIIISGRCRFEKYGANRAGCYWLGGGEE